MESNLPSHKRDSRCYSSMEAKMNRSAATRSSGKWCSKFTQVAKEWCASVASVCWRIVPVLFGAAMRLANAQIGKLRGSIWAGGIDEDKKAQGQSTGGMASELSATQAEMAADEVCCSDAMGGQ